MSSKCIARSSCLSRQARPKILLGHQYFRRTLLTLAIETSCDDTSVAILEKLSDSTTLHFHQKITSENRIYGGVHPLVALESHQCHLSTLVQKALSSLPPQRSAIAHLTNTLLVDGDLKKKPDFVTVTRGPGMRSSLQTGIDTAKGLAVAWQIPLLGVNHMQAHALTPRLVSALAKSEESATTPAFPFVTFLVSGGHTMLVQSLDLCNHEILAETTDMALGDVLDKCARDILPEDTLKEGSSVMYGPLLESFAGAPQYVPPCSNKESNRTRSTPYQWSLPPPYCSEKGSGERRTAMEYNFSSIGSTVKRIMSRNPSMFIAERRVLAQETMRVAFEHLISRLFFLDLSSLQTIVISGGVASNQFLRRITRSMLDARGYKHVQVTCPPPALCTDNAAMIAWTGIEMWEAGYESGLGVTALKKWTIDPSRPDGGILGVGGWLRRNS